MTRLLIIPLVLILLLIGAVAWSGGGGQPRSDFTFINRGDIYTLDLNQMSYMQDFRLTYGIREGLYGPDPETLRPVPAGATGYELSDDKKVWTFHLRPGAKWSNGDPVTSRDYVFSWRRMLEEPWDYKRRLLLKRSKTNWDRANVKCDTIEMIVSENVLNQFLLYEAGTVDWVAEVLGDLPAELKAKGRKDLRVSPAFGTMFISFLCRPNLPQSVGGGRNPLADVRVRQALAI